MTGMSDAGSKLSVMSSHSPFFFASRLACRREAASERNGTGDRSACRAKIRASSSIVMLRSSMFIASRNLLGGSVSLLLQLGCQVVREVVFDRGDASRKKHVNMHLNLFG